MADISPWKIEPACNPETMESSAAGDSSLARPTEKRSDSPSLETGQSPKVHHNSEQQDDGPSRDWRFWAILLPLCIASILVALEGTVVSTALPSIEDEIRTGDLYVWLINGYYVALYVPLALLDRRDRTNV
jgi:hypothetical protein